MHQAPDYLVGKIFTFQNIQNNLLVSLTSQDESTAINYLHHDALEYFYSSVVSLCDGIRGIEQSFYTWAIVKLYYSVFYLLRAILASKSICIFYIKTTPCNILIRAGEKLVKGSGNTHGFVLKLYNRICPGSILLSQEIDSKNPLDWLESMREVANYKQSKFCEPDVPEVFKKAVDQGLNTVVQAYLNDSSYLYAFDPDHAMLAYPLSLLVHADSEISSAISFRYNRKDIFFLKKIMTKYRLSRDKKYELC